MRSLTADEIMSGVRLLIGDEDPIAEQSGGLVTSQRVLDSDVINAINYACRDYCRRMFATPEYKDTVFDANGIVKIPFDSLVVQRLTVIRNV